MSRTVKVFLCICVLRPCPYNPASSHVVREKIRTLPSYSAYSGKSINPSALMDGTVGRPEVLVHISPGCRWPIQPACRPPDSSVSVAGSTQCEVESGPLPHCAFGPHTPPVPVDNALDRSQPNPGAWEVRLSVQSLKRGKQLVRLGRIETGPVVA